MQCRHCGTEIADRAIVCYRCGTATTDPVRKAVPKPRRRSWLPSLVAAALLLAAAGYAAYASQMSPAPDRWQIVAGALAGAAVVVVILSLLRRRR